MFTTKKDVDKHVKTGFAKLRSDNEVKIKCFSNFLISSSNIDYKILKLNTYLKNAYIS